MLNPNDIHYGPKAWHWTEGKVNTYQDHFPIYYGDIEKVSLDKSPLVALVGSPKDRIFNVKFLIKPSSDENKKILKNVKRELNFYITDTNEPDAYRYLQYHCATASNIYSNVHWGYSKAMPLFERFLILFHTIVVLYSIWIAQKFFVFFGIDVLWMNEPLLWIVLSISILSILSIIFLYKRVSWSFPYIKKLTFGYIGLIGMSLLIYFI